MELVALALSVPVLVVAAVSDLRHLRIPNRLSLILLALFAASCPFLPVDEILLRVVAAGAVFAIGFVLFAFHLFGGGDVKLLSALMLLLPSSSLMLFGYVFSASMLAGILAIVLLRAAPLRLGAHWASMQDTRTLPMGISIALAGLLQFLILLNAA